MIKILCGKSGSGKDWNMRRMIEEGWKPIVSWTSRPMRDGEVEGREYHFCSKREFEYMITNDKLIEYRWYNTLYKGNPEIWYYGLAKEELDKDSNYVVVLDLNGAKSFKEYYKDQDVSVIYIYCDDELRKQRAMQRGSFDETEWNRRLQADSKDFSEEKLKEIVDVYMKNE